MSVFVIHFLNFGVFVHHQRGLSVVLGADRHNLRYKVAGGGFKAIPAGTTINFKVRQGTQEIVGGPTRSHTGSYMVSLEWLFARSMAIDPTRVIGPASDGQNARVHLHGGDLMDQQGGSLLEPHPVAEALWDFRAFGAKAPSLHRITNRATFVHPVEEGFEYSLELSTGAKERLGAGMQVIIENEDSDENKEECEKRGPLRVGDINRELQRLLPAVGIDPGGAAARVHSLMSVAEPPGSICQPCDVIETHQMFDFKD